VFAAEVTSDDKPWFHDIKVFLQTQEYPPGASRQDKKTLRRLSSSFFLNGDVLSKGTLMRSGSDAWINVKYTY